MTNNVVEQAKITVTVKAVEQILSLMAERELDSHYLRVFVEGVGCSGYQCGMAFSEEPQEDDTIVNSNGIRVLVDSFSLGCLDGVIVDFVETPDGADFIIENPNQIPGSACKSCSASCG